MQLYTLLVALANFARNHPIATSATGATGGLAAWFVTWGEHLALLFRLVAGGAGAALAVVSLVLITPRCLRFIRNWRKKGLMAADSGESTQFPPAP